MRRLAVFGLLLTGACQPRTEMMIGIATDIRAPDIINGVQLNVTRTRDGFPEQQLPPWTITGIPDQPFNLPGSYGVYSPDGSEVKVQIEMTGLKGDTPVVVRHAIVSLVNGKTLFLRMGLVAGCMGKKDCGPTQTCIEGQCRERLVDVRQLPNFFQNLVTELTCDSGTTYIDTATGDPMPFSADAMNCPASLCSEGTCLLPPPDDGGVPVPDQSAADMTNAIDMLPPLRGCPGDVLGTPQLMATTTGVGALLIDGASGSLVWTEDMSLAIQMSDPCTASPQLIATAPGPIAGGVIQGGQLFFTSIGTILHIPIAPGSSPMVVTDSTQLPYMTTDGTDLFWLAGPQIMRLPNGTAAPIPLQGPMVSPQSPLLAVGGAGANETAFWFDTMGANDMSALGLLGMSVPNGGNPIQVAPLTMSLGLFADANNVYWTDSSQGLMMRALTGTPAVQVAPPGTMLDTGGRLTGDGTYLYFTSVAGKNDVILQALPTANATVQTLATAQSVDNSPNFPKLAVGAHGVYWVDPQQHIWRAPALP